MSILSKLKPVKGSKKKMKRIGRGDASGHGGTSTKGHKGQLARSSPHITRGFEGGQMPLHRRSPKWGFTNHGKTSYSVINLGQLSEKFKDGETVNKAACIERKLLKRNKLPLKILGSGVFKLKNLNIEASAFSKTAKQALEASGSHVALVKI